MAPRARLPMEVEQMARAVLTRRGLSSNKVGQVIWRLAAGGTPKQENTGRARSSGADDEGFMSAHSTADQLPHTTLRPITLRWVLKRTAIAVAILFVAISSMAWLTYASIDPQLDAQGADDTPGVVDLTKVNLRF